MPDGKIWGGRWLGVTDGGGEEKKFSGGDDLLLICCIPDRRVISAPLRKGNRAERS